MTEQTYFPSYVADNSKLPEIIRAGEKLEITLKENSLKCWDYFVLFDAKSIGFISSISDSDENGDVKCTIIMIGFPFDTFEHRLFKVGLPFNSMHFNFIDKIYDKYETK